MWKKSLYAIHMSQIAGHISQCRIAHIVPEELRTLFPV